MMRRAMPALSSATGLVPARVALTCLPASRLAPTRMLAAPAAPTWAAPSLAPAFSSRCGPPLRLAYVRPLTTKASSKASKDDAKKEEEPKPSRWQQLKTTFREHGCANHPAQAGCSHQPVLLYKHAMTRAWCDLLSGRPARGVHPPRAQAHVCHLLHGRLDGQLWCLVRRDDAGRARRNPAAVVPRRRRDAPRRHQPGYQRLVAAPCQRTARGRGLRADRALPASVCAGDDAGGEPLVVAAARRRRVMIKKHSTAAGPGPPPPAG
eukprot:6043674-Prymnesium_polylepis.1